MIAMEKGNDYPRLDVLDDSCVAFFFVYDC